MRRVIAIGALLAAAAAGAQELPPGHPSVGGESVDEGAPALPPGHPSVGESGDEGAGALPPGHPSLGEGGDGAADPHGGGGGDPHGGGRADLRLPADDSKDAVEEVRDLPRGTIEVRVVTPEGDGVGSQRVEVAILGSDQSRELLTRTTGADGRVRLSGLATGDGQAYRVYAPYRGAKYGSEPFQLGLETGTRVTLTRWPVTNDASKLLLFRGRTIVLFGEEGMKIQAHMGFMNFGAETVVPHDGILRIPLPRGARAFQSQAGMTDQKLSMDEEEGHEAALVQGSFPPGEAQLMYGFQVPLDGTEATLEARIPFRTVVYDVIVEKAPGMKLHVAGMPDPEEAELQNGTTVLTTSIQRRPGSPPFERLRIEISGLPGKGPGRWFIVTLVAVLVGLGVWSLLRGGDPRSLQAAARRSERERLIGLAVSLEREHAAGKADGDAYERRKDRILNRLAEIYRADEASP